MASKTFNRSGPTSFDVNPSPDVIYHLPISPSEPGKFDFYRVHLVNQPHHSDPVFSDNSDAPVLSTSTALTTVAKRRWTPFADLVSTPTSKSPTVPSINSSVSSDTNGKSNESGSSLTNAVKNAMKKGQLDVPVNPIRRPISGTTLSTKDLNHLSPQSM